MKQFVSHRSSPMSNPGVYGLYDVLNVKRRICSSVGDHIDNSALKKQETIKKLLIIKWTKFHVELRKFLYYGLILVSYKKRVAYFSECTLVMFKHGKA